VRSEVQQLPSGQDISRKIGQVPLAVSELGIPGPAYLWFYLLKQAELRPPPRPAGLGRRVS
jgi:hypothetical protein